MTSTAGGKGVAEGRQTIGREKGSMLVARRSTTEDADEIEEMLAVSPAARQQVEAKFGNLDIPFLVENCAVPITILSSSTGRICAFAAFTDAAPPWASAGTTPASEAAFRSPQSALWALAFIADPTLEKKAAHEAVKAAFVMCPDVDVLNVAMPRGNAYGAGEGPFFALFEDVTPTPRGHTKSEGAVRYLVCRRTGVAPKLKIRIARVEDHDDLVPIFNKQSDLDSKVHEQFFLAHVIEKQDENNRAFVAEQNNKAIGIVCVSADVQNSDLLKQFPTLSEYTGEKLEEDVLLVDPLKHNLLIPPYQSTPHLAVVPPPEPATPKPTTPKPIVAPMTPKLIPPTTPKVLVPNTPKFTLPPTPKGPPTPKITTPDPAAAAATQQAKEQQKPKGPRGLTRAVCITLFCLDESVMHRSYDFIKPIFDQFPDKDYILLTQPYTAPVTPLLRFFVQVPPISHSSFGHVLYVLTRAGFSGDFQVRKADTPDIPALTQMFSTIQSSPAYFHSILPPGSLSQGCLELCNKTFGVDGEGTCYVATCKGVIVGVSVIKKLESSSVQSLFEDYDVDSYIPGKGARPGDEYGTVDMLYLSASLQSKTRAFLTSILAAPRCGLFLSIKPNSQAPSNSLLELFFLAKTRRQIQKNGSNKCGRVLPSLFVITPRLLREAKTYINNRIVVIGASTVGLSFINTLLSMPYCVYSHITLVSPFGIPPTEPNLWTRCSLDSPHYASLQCAFFENEFDSCGIRSRITVLKNKLIGIDRPHKTVHFLQEEDDAPIPYDQLVLTVGNQPRFTGSGLTGVFLNPSNDDVIQQLDDLINDSQRESAARVVVCGGCLNAVAMVSYLLSKYNKSGNKSKLGAITFVRNASNGNDHNWLDDMPDDYMSNQLLGTLAHIGIEVYESATLDSVKPNGDSDQLGVVSIVRGDQVQQEIPADVLIAYSPSLVDVDAFYAFNDSCLVFDGKMIVNSNFQTNDSSIFAAGSFTKYTQQMGDATPMTTWSSREIGSQLAAALLHLSGHFPDGVPLHTPARTPQGTIQFTSPVSQAAVLPGGLFFFCTRLPVMRTEGGEIISKPERTASAYLRLHCDEAGKFDRVIYLGSDRCEVDNYCSIIGLPHSVFNNVLERFTEKLVPDLAGFFRESWAMPLYHDRFASFLADLEGTMRNWMGDATAKAVKELDPKACKSVQEFMVSFLQANESQLPNFALPQLSS